MKMNNYLIYIYVFHLIHFSVLTRFLEKTFFAVINMIVHNIMRFAYDTFFSFDTLSALKYSKRKKLRVLMNKRSFFNEVSNNAA